MIGDQKGQLIGPDQLRSISKDIRSIVNSTEISAEDGKKPIYFASIVADVLFTSNSPTIDALHRVAAWNALSTVIAQSLTSNIVEIQSALWEGGVWLNAFEIYLTHAPNAKPKVTQQLLAALITSLKKGSNDETALIKKHVVEKMLHAILDFDDPYRSKVSAQLLSGMLGKKVVSLDEVLADATLQQGPQVVHFPPRSVQYLLWILFQWISRSDFGSSVAQLVSKLLERYYENETSDESIPGTTEAPVWALPLEVSMSHASANVDDLRAHALPILFKRSFRDFLSFLHTTGLTSLMDTEARPSGSVNEQLLCAALQSGNELGLVRTEAVKEIQQTSSALILPVQVVGRLLLRGSRTLRLTGLSLLIYSNSPLRPLPKASFQILKNALPNFFADPDADFRSDLFGLFHKLLDRLKSVTSAQARQTKLRSAHQSPLDNVGPDAAAPVTAYHEEFLQWTVRFLTWELRPTASYQRHICSLKCLTILVRCGLDPAVGSPYLSKSALGEVRWPSTMSILTPGLRDSLVTLLLDPFDDVRSASAAILSMYISDPHDTGWSNTINSALDRATELMLASGRADQADGVAHLWALKHRITTKGGDEPTQPDVTPPALMSLISKLKEMLDIARISLTEAVTRYPMHGILIALRYVISHDSSSITTGECSQISELLHEAWLIVKPTLCDDAPEGYLPDELDTGSNSTKEVLSYCWRALKEASILLNVLVQSSRIDSNTLRALCELCFTQLVELRHRGAFSTVAQTWVSCCSRSTEIQSSSGGVMFVEWYSKVIRMLENNITINTRRSAGLPSLLCGILNVDHNGELMSQAMTDLTRIARLTVDKSLAEGGALSQVHAMNCMKDILKNSRLGERTERYVPSTLELAADALHSDVWAIRNCGLMLFRAVIDRLLGTSDSFFGDEATGRRCLSSEQYPELLEVILGLLNRSSPAPSAGSVARNEGVFPALQLLQYAEIPEHRVNEVRNSITALMANPSWHVRDAAARAYAFVVKLQIQDFQELFCRAQGGQNALHGSLLAAKHLVARLQPGPRESQLPKKAQVSQILASQIFDAVVDYYPAIFDDRARCHATKGAYLDVVRESLILFASTTDNAGSQSVVPRLPDVLGDIETHLVLSRVSVQSSLDKCGSETGSAVLIQALARLFAVRLAVVPVPDEAERAAAMNLVQDFANTDEDACVYLLKEIDRVLYLVAQDNRALIYETCENIFRGNWGWELKLTAHDLLSHVLSHEKTSMLQLMEVADDDSAHLFSLPRTNQHYADGWLQTRAIKLESEAVSSNAETRVELRSKVTAWARDCTLAIQGTSVFTPEAAASSLDRVDTLWNILASDKGSHHCLGDLCLAVYDILNDDEEDIRLQAARITGRILRAQNQTGDIDFEPITAGQRLLGFCVAKLRVNDKLVTTAFERAFGITTTKPWPVADRLAAYLQTDNALFVQEKQNLYVDEAREARIWSRAIMKLPSTDASQRLMQSLVQWVFDGLDVLTKHMKDKYDGGLGWSTGSDVFILGLQVIYGAEILLWQVKNDHRISARPSDLRQKLLGFAVASDASDVNCLWQWEVQRVLKESIVFKVAKISQMVGQVRPFS